MSLNKRKHQRFSATAFLNTPVKLSPLAPFFGKMIVGKIIDLSAGGMAIVIDDLIPQETKLGLEITFPDQTKLSTTVKIAHVTPRGRQYLHGFEFLSIPTYMAEKIENMSVDYVDCENRMAKNIEEICRLDCSFYSMCTKMERRTPILDVDVCLEMAFKILAEYNREPSTR